jgi:hypothetical protein
VWWAVPEGEKELVKRGKGTRGMPGRGQARKDVASCDKPRGGARILRSADFRMGQPGGSHIPSPFFGREPTRGTETSQYPEEEKSSEIPRVAASERGGAQTGRFRPSGVEGPMWGAIPFAVWGGVEAAWNGPPQQVRAL